MQLFYHRFPGGVSNFGDSLNEWLWPRVLPGVFDSAASSAFIGFGTLLNSRLRQELPFAKMLAIFSTGAGYHHPIDNLWPNDHIYCVRGPLTAAALGLPNTAAITDGALLIRGFARPNANRSHRFAFMPHIEKYASEAWPEVCAELGFGYVDPTWSIEQVIDAIGDSEVLITEAMHGAVVADAMRIPWIAVRSSHRILRFKWEDWCASIGVAYAPRRIGVLRNRSQTNDMLRPVRDARFFLRRMAAFHDLDNVSRTAKPILSTDRLSAELHDRLLSKAEIFRADVEAGVFLQRYAA